MKSEFYVNLCKRIDALRRALLPARFSPTGNYRDSTYERTRAFHVLSHAEFEYYLEQIAFSIATKSYKKWSDDGTASATIIALCVYYSGTYGPIPKSTNGNHSLNSLTERIKNAYSDYSNKVYARNHGIREENILQLLLPIGLHIDDIGNELVIALDNYGAKRGPIAHSTRATTVLSPKDALSLAQELLTLILPLDEKLVRMLN